MDYKEKYKKALERAKKLYEQGTITESLGYVFPELTESEDERIRKGLIENFKWFCGDYPETTKWGKDDNLLVKDIIAWLEKQSKKKSADEVLKIRQELYQSGYNDGYKHGYNHGQNNIAIALKKESIEALEHFVRGIGESGYASPYDNRTKLVYKLLNQLKQIVK